MDDLVAQYSLFAIYDVAIVRWLRRIMATVCNDALVVKASPMRAFSAAKDVIRRNTPPSQGPHLPNAEKVAVIPLPLISFQRGGLSAREFGRTAPFNFQLKHRDESGGSVFSSAPPLPLWLNYDVEVWTKTEAMQSMLVTEMISAFDPYISNTAIDVGVPWGVVQVPIRLRGVEDVSELEGGDVEDRQLRHSFSLQVEAWRFPVRNMQLTAKEVKTSIRSVDEATVRDLDFARYDVVYMQANDGHWFKVSSVNYGDVHVFPCAPPQEPEIYIGDSIIRFRQGLLLNDDTNVQGPYRLEYHTTKPQFRTRYYPTQVSTASKCLAVPMNQRLLFGFDDAQTHYGELTVNFGALGVNEAWLVTAPPATDSTVIQVS